MTDKWKSTVQSTSALSPTKEEYVEAMEKWVQNQEDNFGKVPEPILHPLQYRDMLMYLCKSKLTKEKANKAVMELAKKQGDFTKEGLITLKKSLEK